MPQNTFMRALITGDTKTIIASLLLIGIIIFFATSYYIGRNKASIALISYYILLSTLFFKLDTNFVASGIINGKTLFMFYTASLIPLVIAVKFFMKITHDRKPMENMALIGIAVFIAAFSIVYLSILGLNYTAFIIFIT